MDQDRQPYTTQQENFKKKSYAGMENHEFDRQAALFNGASMEVIT
jgi:hypothetical protein